MFMRPKFGLFGVLGYDENYRLNQIFNIHAVYGFYGWPKLHVTDNIILTSAFFHLGQAFDSLFVFDIGRKNGMYLE